MNEVHTVYVIHHSHTDIGYTHDQPILWDLTQRFIDEAITLAEKYANHTSDGAFRWTIENTAPLLHWLQHASDADIARLIALERNGRIEVTGMFANVTPLFDTDQLIESLQPIRRLREQFGFTIRYAMNCDVNGENWPLVDLLLDSGIEGFTMAINTHFGGAPLQRPNAFWWEGPSGRQLLTWNGWPYDQGWRLGIGRDAAELEHTWWPRVEQRLAEIDHPLPILMVQTYHPFGDNGSAFEGFSHFIEQWNEDGKSPRLCLATPTMWWAALQEYSHLLPTYRGDWTDYWNFGCISSAREQAINRASRVRLRTADALAAAVLAPNDVSQAVGMDPSSTAPPLMPTSWTAISLARYREPAWWALHLWDEHTWGTDISIRHPFSEDTISQWVHKANYAYTARSLSLLLQRDALADLARQVGGAAPGDLFLFNPLPWPRLIAGQVSQWVQTPRGPTTDTTAGRHFQDRMADVDYLLEPDTAAVLGTEAGEANKLLPPTEVPGLGYVVVPRGDLIDLHATTTVSEETVVENERHRLTFDSQRGGILSWYDKRLEYEWVDQEAGYPFNAFVHERLAGERLADTPDPQLRQLLFEMAWVSDRVERPRGWKPEWGVQRGRPTKVLTHRVYHTPLGQRVVQSLAAPGCAGPLQQSVFLPNYADYLECESSWEMGLEVQPEATYILYPCHVPNAVARLDLGGQAMTAGRDQLPGVCRDYFTAQQWVDFSNGELGMTVALPDNPIVQLGDFHFGHNQAEFRLERALLLGWVTNNYWETNFRAHQPGRIRARYCLLPYSGGFDEAQAHRFGWEMANARPLLLQHLGEERANRQPLLPTSGSLLHLPGSRNEPSPVLTLHVKPSTDQREVVVRLLNASDEEQPAEIGSGLLRISSAQACDILEAPLSAVAVTDGTVRLPIPARRVATVCLAVGSEQ